MLRPELEQKLLQLDHNKKLYIIQLLAQSLTIQDTHLEQPTKLSQFFRQSPLAQVGDELNLSRDCSLS
ncbi:hypothetical protein H6G76_32305 [Nostoc sp. FACHB-152]|uniref:hypothetical protein n=1 Tax=unclassified Nostoc TaxID=2593658 RepID=UPI001685A7C3|nr:MULTISPECIES: hypothetical protein [unclassified Nostoc]MBD2451721.1 hypothetical protein [Nostoc sp. FACHB-152]MBD2473218.1 hypothetical protein [Nostoc sp. FACHB-145]